MLHQKLSAGKDFFLQQVSVVPSWPYASSVLSDELTGNVMANSHVLTSLYFRATCG